MMFEPLRDFENDYEIEVEEPHRIRRIGSDRFVSTSMNHNYVQMGSVIYPPKFLGDKW